MKQYILLFALVLCGISDSYAQASGSFFTIQFGQKKCLFKYTEQRETTTSKNNIALRKFLTQIDTTSKSIDIKYPWAKDTVTAINPVTKKEETKIITYTSADYHIATEMTYSDFLLLLKSRFELRNPQKTLRVYSYNIYYETATEGGMIRVKYPQTAEGVIAKLNVLVKGGFILLSLKAADHDLIPIDAGGSFLALIRIKN